MRGRTAYKTKHRDAIMSVLEEHAGEHITAAGIHDCLRSRGVAIGTATVYRQLEKLVEEGLADKYVVDAASGACYEYAGGHEGPSRYVHCKCEKCGRLVHVERKAFEAAMRSISLAEAAGGFEMDLSHTVFYGICRDCKADGVTETKETGESES